METTDGRSQASSAILHGKSVALTSRGEYPDEPNVLPELRVRAPLRQSGDSGENFLVPWLPEHHLSLVILPGVA